MDIQQNNNKIYVNFIFQGFFVAVSPESIMLLGKHAHEKGHTFIMNLSAPFVSQFYKEPLEQMLPYVDVMFGNESVSDRPWICFDGAKVTGIGIHTFI